MKKNITHLVNTILITVILVSTLTCGAFAGTDLSITAETGIIYSATTNEVIWSKSPDKEMNLASITKLMTCLIAAEELGLDYEVTVSEEATKVKKSESYVYAGEKITVRDLIYESLLVSANDAAKALAIGTSGSVKDFVKLMNARAKEIGCTHTHFANATGIANKNHYSSARDVALIAAEVFKNQDIKKIAGTAEYTVAATNKGGERKLETTNLFLNGGEAQTTTGTVKVKKYSSVFGGKTGTTDQSAATMVVGAKINGFEVYCVILGSTLQERYNDVAKLMDYTKTSISKYMVFDKGLPCGNAKITGGATNKVSCTAAKEGFINLPDGASASLVTTKIVYDSDLNAPIEKGQKVGTIEIYLADEFVRAVDLIADNSVKKGWALSKFGITNLQTVIICVILLILLSFVILIMSLRAANKRKRRRIREARLRELARRQLEREADVRQRNWPY